MATPTRIYTVTDKADASSVRLIRAINPSQALRHVAGARFEAKPANQEALVKALTGGAVVEDATIESTQQELGQEGQS